MIQSVEFSQVSQINQKLARIPLPKGAIVEVQFSREKNVMHTHCYLLLSYLGRYWTTQYLGVLYDHFTPQQRLRGLGDYLGEKLPAIETTWRAYHESNLWC